MSAIPPPDDDGRVFDRDRMEHSGHRPEFSTHAGIAAFRPQLRVSKKGDEPGRHWMRLVINERGIHRGKKFHQVWAVYAFGELARWACECIQTGDRIIVVGYERGTNKWVDKQGRPRSIEDITAWDIGMSMLRNPAYSERNENQGKRSRNQRRREEGYPDVDYSPVDWPDEEA